MLHVTAYVRSNPSAFELRVLIKQEALHIAASEPHLTIMTCNWIDTLVKPLRLEKPLDQAQSALSSVYHGNKVHNLIRPMLHKICVQLSTGARPQSVEWLLHLHDPLAMCYMPDAIGPGLDDRARQL